MAPLCGPGPSATFSKPAALGSGPHSLGTPMLTPEERRQHHIDSDKRWREAHPEEKQKHNREGGKRFRTAHPDRVREKKRSYRESHREEIRAYARAYYAAHSQSFQDRAREYRKAHREQIREYTRRWENANPEKIRAIRQTVRLRRRNAPGEFGVGDLAILFTNQRGRCWWCRCKLNAYDVDHRFSIARGGDSNPSNLVLSCPACNRRKQAKTPQEFCGRLL